MPVRSVFIDTTALLALINADDALHDAASEAYSKLTRTGAALVTSDWVVAEFLNGASRPPMRGAAVQLLAAYRGSMRSTLLPASHEWWEAALALYGARPDKSWSFIDCTSIIACREQQVTQVLTHDRHFEQAGFELLIR